MTDRAERNIIYALSAITLLSAFGTRFAFWGDEAGTVEIITEKWSGFLGWFVSGEPHPPLYFALLKLWGGIFGFSEFSLRAPSILFFPIVVILTWKLAGQLGLGRVGRIISSLIVALHPSMWIFARMARYYLFTEALFLASTIFLLRAIDRDGKLWIIYGVFIALALWSNFTVYLLIPIHLSIIFLKNKTRIKNWIIVTVGAIALSLPSIYFFARSAISYAEDSVPSLKSVVIGVGFTIYDFLIGEVRYPWQILTALALLSAIFLFAIALKRKTALTILVAGAPLLLGALVLAVLFQKLPFTYYPARVLFLLPCVAIAMGIGAESLKPRAAFITILLLFSGYIWGIFGVLSGKDYINTVYVLPWRDVTSRLKEREVESAISRDWGAVHYLRQEMTGILLRDGLDTELPDGKAAHVWRSGAFKLLELDSMVQERLLSERGAPIDSFSIVPENEKIKYLKKIILGLDSPDNIISVYIFDEKENPCASHIPGK
ncbi:glycosyltransferase family 39 protein [bacterium]|nr:glycosyltransferase family 39 protein [bacterium]